MSIDELAVPDRGSLETEHRALEAHRLAVLATGGTIAMTYDAAAEGAMPSVEPQQLVAGLPKGLPALAVEKIAQLPSSHFQIDTLWVLRERVAELMTDSTVDGVVITHGTDTLEETACLLDVTVPLTKPVVLTGAMRAVSEPGYEGGANLLAAIRVAATSQAQQLGVVVVFDDEIHAARFVTKMHTLSTHAFGSPGRGPVGRISGATVSFDCSLQPHILPWRGLEPNVSLVTLAVGADPDLLEAALERGARGVVLETLGGGRVPPWWLSVIGRARDRGVPVVIGSRCPAGPVWDAYGYEGAHRSLAELGCLFAGDLNGQKARIRLMVVLAAAQHLDDVTRLWAT
jgi:L-asparaginase